MKYVRRLLLLAILIGIVAYQFLPRHYPSGVRPATGFDKQVMDATFILYSYYQGETTARCTATAYQRVKNGYYLISAGHCTYGAPTDMTWLVASDFYQPKTEVQLVKSRYDEILDFSVFELDTLADIPIIPLGTEHDARVGDPIISVGFGHMIGKQLTHGIVSTQLMYPTTDCSICGGKFLAQIYGASGSSGSAIVSKQTHKILGVLVVGFGGEGPTVNIGFAVQPISSFPSFVASPYQKVGPNQ